MAHQLPEIGWLRLPQIIGSEEVTKEQAAENRKRDKGPKRPRAAIPPIVPISKSAWWAGCACGRFPKPVKLGPRTTAWSVDSIRAYLASAK